MNTILELLIYFTMAYMFYSIYNVIIYKEKLKPLMTEKGNLSKWTKTVGVFKRVSINELMKNAQQSKKYDEANGTKDDLFQRVLVISFNDNVYKNRDVYVDVVANGLLEASELADKENKEVEIFYSYNKNMDDYIVSLSSVTDGDYQAEIEKRKNFIKHWKKRIAISIIVVALILILLWLINRANYA